MKDSVAERKKNHIDITMQRPVRFENRSHGFDNWYFDHHALPEINFSHIDSSTKFLGKSIAFPLMISGMTGGYKRGDEINHQLIKIAEVTSVAFGLGSMRPLINNPGLKSTYRAQGKLCKTVPFVGNIGAVNLFSEINENIIHTIVEEIGVDALAVHLNPLQEVIQPEGDTNFKGVLNNIEKLVSISNIPIIVKETGAGISGKMAKQLSSVGVSIIDVSGAGGTSWSAVEAYRTNQPTEGLLFKEWGIPTAVCVQECAKIDSLTVIASGGIDNGLTMAKACALGAKLCSVAFPVLKCLEENGEKGLIQMINNWKDQFRKVLFLTGSKTTTQLNRTKLRAI